MTELACDQEGRLLKHAIALLNKDPRSSSHLSMSLNIPLHWLISIRNNRIPKPAVNRIEYIINSLDPGYFKNCNKKDK